jgi:aryl-alcohol dehydrogenase-like predicted oxidoreductase
MDLRPLGSTGIAVTPIGLGLAAVGRPGYINLGRGEDLEGSRTPDDMRRRSHLVLDAAYAAGIRYVDAARSYGRAEEFLASWLETRGMRPDAVVVGSKWGYTYTAGWVVGAEVNEVKDHSVATLRRQIAESRALLGAHLRLYQIHSATLESGVLDDPAVLCDLVGLRESGIAVGFSASGPRQADTVRHALDARVDGEAVFQTVQATWNVLEPSAGPALAEAAGEGLGIIVKEALANGRLAGRGTGPAADALRGIAVGSECGPDAVAVAAALANPWASVVLSGAVTPAQLESNVAALGVGLSGDDLARLSDLAEEPAGYWAARSGLPWT